MVRALPIAEWLGHELPIIDVRSPGEFDRGHVPGAHNMPLFTDEERAVVGTLYKRTGRDAAVLEGLRIVGPRLASLVEQARALAPDGNVRVHCWRGGERSGSVAWLLDRAGFTQVLTLQRGYKGFRNHVLASFSGPQRLLVLGGYTGSGKTVALHHLRALGEQTIDLEALAHHKGSAFGAIGEAPQPTTEQFENELWHALRTLDPTRPYWVEDESLMIGRVKLPDPFFARMRSSFLFFAEIPMEERADHLVRIYGAYPKEALAEAIVRIGKRLGPQHCKAALEALAMDDLHTVALIALRYYDKTYAKGASLRDQRLVARASASANDLRGLAETAIAHARAHSHAGTGTPDPA